MTKKHLLISFFSLLLFSEAFAQLTKSEEELVAPTFSNTFDRNYLVDFNLRGFGSTQERLPFWFYQNQRGRVSEDSNFSAWISGKAVRYLTPESYFILGAGVLYQDGGEKGALADELYLHFQNSWMYATAGQKQQPMLYNGLSASNESILWSLNARPMPGIQIGTTDPIFLFSDEGFGFEGSWNEYLMGKDRFVPGAKVHHKEFRFVYRKGSWLVKAGFQHMAQWSGTSPTNGKQPDTFEDYMRIVTGLSGDANATEGDQLSALGNHLGGWEAYVYKEFRNFRLELFYNHIFEDGSGIRLSNTPDGRYGIFYEHNNKNQLISSVMYEWYYTHHQSYTTTGVHKHDDYFNNGNYRSGWTYERRVIGAPFFTVNPDPENLIAIINNKFAAHHIGIGGQIGNYFNVFPYRLLLSYAHNDGRYNRRYRPLKQNVFYGLFDLRLLDENAISIDLQLGLELNSYTVPVYGAGVHLSYIL